MSSERIIQIADLSLILGSLRSLQSDIGTVSGQVSTVGQELADTRSELSRLEQAFADFVEADLKAKELSLAETRQVKIRQEIENLFGQNAVVRRQATGILQASDVQLVRQDTLRGATEELMLSTPRYWLAPALVALAAWLGDNRDLAQRALAEAIRRDDEKTSLFFALVSRRAGRQDATRTWLDRYFGLQDPRKLDRQTVVMVDAMANGVFSADATQLCSRRIAAWIEELSEQAGFAEAQRTQWSKALLTKVPRLRLETHYVHLKRCSPTWEALDKSLDEAGMHEVVLQYFEQIFQGEIKPASSVLIAADDLLTKLVTRFDDDELPLRRQEELCGLIIAEDGDKRRAQQRYDLQSKALDEQVDFTQLLTNAAMHPETSHVTRATQRFAIAHSRDWVLDAHRDLTARARQGVPQNIAIDIEGWSGQTRNGDNESELLASLAAWVQKTEEEALAKVKLGFRFWAMAALGVALVVGGLGNLFMMLVGLGALAWAYSDYRKAEQLRARIRASSATLRETSAQVLRACLAEVVELRRDIVQRETFAERVEALLQGISPGQHMLSAHDKVRRVMAQAA